MDLAQFNGDRRTRSLACPKSQDNVVIEDVSISGNVGAIIVKEDYYDNL